MIRTDTIIIGAGAAGLAAGAALAEAGREFLILEARDRIGGRLHTVRDPHWPVPLEFGAEFIHGRPEESWDLASQAGLHVYDVANEHWQSKNGKPQKSGKNWDAVEKVMDRLGRVKPGDASFSDFLKVHCKNLPAPARAMARAVVEGLDAADAELVSSQSILASEKDGEKFDADLPFRIFEGYDRLLEPMVNRLPPGAVLLDKSGRAIEWSRGRVSIETVDGDRFAAARALITLPIGVLQAVEGETGAIRFDPPLPLAMRAAIDQMRMGPVVKVLLRFHHAFWEKGDWKDLAFLHDPGADFPTWWTMLPFRFPILTAWAGGPAAAAMSHRPATEVIDSALHVLSRLLRISEKKLHTELAAWHVSDWQADPYARGAYAFALVGGAKAVRQLAKPIDHTLFFAGEATHPGYAGTVAAAIASGRRAVKQILKRR